MKYQAELKKLKYMRSKLRVKADSTTADKQQWSEWHTDAKTQCEKASAFEEEIELFISRAESMHETDLEKKVYEGFLNEITAASRKADYHLHGIKLSVKRFTNFFS